MSHDNELRSRLGRLADSRTTPELTLGAVEERRARRGRRQRVLAVGAVFALVLGTVGVIQLFGGDDGEVDVASDLEDEAAEELIAEDTDEPAPATTTTVVSNADTAAASSFGGPGFGGPGSIVAWGDGFLSFDQVFEPSAVTFEEFVPDVADRLSPEILAAIEEAGVTDIQESIDVLTEAGLIDQATAEVTADPVLLDAYSQVTSGGTYRLEASISPDGEEWTVLDGFAPPSGSEFFNSAQSDGEHLVIAEQTWDEESGRTSEILVSSTTDLVNWTSTSVPFDEPDVPDYVQADVGFSGVALNSTGWYLTTVTSGWIDIWSLLPDDVRAELESNGGYGWSTSPEGVVLETYEYDEYDEYEASTGDAAATTAVVPDETAPETTIPSTTPAPPPPQDVEIEPTETHTIPWSELGITYDDYRTYDAVEGGEVAHAWVGTWDGSIVSAVPAAPVNCCQVVGTDAGYIAQSWRSYEAGPSAPEGPQLHFSADGQNWTDLAPPVDDQWIGGLTAVVDGLIMTTSGNDGRQQVWRGDATGESWQLVEIPGLPANADIWFNDTSSRGVASVIDLSVYEEPFEQIEYDTTFEHDGFEISIFSHSDGSSDLRVVEVASGEQLAEYLGVWPDGEDSDVVAYGDDDFRFLSPDGETIVAVPIDVLVAATSTAMEEAREVSGWVEPDYDYDPDLWFVASVDGLSWYVEDLPDDSPNEYFGQAAVNGTTAVVRGESGWTTFDIG